FAVQCHTGYALLVAAGLAAMVVCIAVQRHREQLDEAERQSILRSWWGGVAIGVLMWIPPVIDQIRRSPGNLRILWNHFTSSTDADGTPRAFVGIWAAVKAFAGEIALPAPWLRGDFRQPGDTPNVFGLIVAVGVIGG